MCHTRNNLSLSHLALRTFDQRCKHFGYNRQVHSHWNFVRQFCAVLCGKDSCSHPGPIRFTLSKEFYSSSENSDYSDFLRLSFQYREKKRPYSNFQTAFLIRWRSLRLLRVMAAFFQEKWKKFLKPPLRDKVDDVWQGLWRSFLAEFFGACRSSSKYLLLSLQLLNHLSPHYVGLP